MINEYIKIWEEKETAMAVIARYMITFATAFSIYGNFKRVRTKIYKAGTGFRGCILRNPEFGSESEAERIFSIILLNAVSRNHSEM